jgi:hypothetical protein
MAEIKSTLEKVLERAAAMGRASKEEIQADEEVKNGMRMEEVKNGMRMAADYLQGKEVNFSHVMEATGGFSLVKKGLVLVFLRNIALPRYDDLGEAKRAMQGLLEMARGSGDLASVFRDMKGILDHYQQQLKEVRQQVEEAFRQQMEQALSKQTGQKGLGLKVDPMLHPKFQEEWSKIKSDLDDQYNKVLQQHKELVAKRFSVTL